MRIAEVWREKGGVRTDPALHPVRRSGPSAEGPESRDFDSAYPKPGGFLTRPYHRLISDGEHSLDVDVHVQLPDQDTGGLVGAKRESR